MIFEVRVSVPKPKKEYYSAKNRESIKETIVKCLHIEARKPNDAFERAKKYGRPLSVRKLDKDKLFGNIENLALNNQVIPYAIDNPYSNAASMDEMIWKKRNERIDNLKKDKPTY
jgi:hypothetical protein